MRFPNLREWKAACAASRCKMTITDDEPIVAKNGALPLMARASTDASNTINTASNAVLPESARRSPMRIMARVQTEMMIRRRVILNESQILWLKLKAQRRVDEVAECLHPDLIMSAESWHQPSRAL
jgi:hypothetical protein